MAILGKILIGVLLGGIAVSQLLSVGGWALDFHRCWKSVGRRGARR